MAKEQQPHWSDILKRRLANSNKGKEDCKLWLALAGYFILNRMYRVKVTFLNHYKYFNNRYV